MEKNSEKHNREIQSILLEKCEGTNDICNQRLKNRMTINSGIEYDVFPAFHDLLITTIKPKVGFLKKEIL